MKSHSESLDDDPKDSTIARMVRHVEEVFFSFLLLSMVVLGLLPIFLRSFHIGSATWTEPLSRQFVLWLAMFGAATATAEKKHIAIDLFGHIFPPKGKILLRIFTSFFSLLVCGFLTYISSQFVLGEKEYASPSSVISSIPEWYFEIILPVGFLLLTVRFAVVIWEECSSFRRQ